MEPMEIEMEGKEERQLLIELPFYPEEHPEDNNPDVLPQIRNLKVSSVEDDTNCTPIQEQVEKADTCGDLHFRSEQPNSTAQQPPAQVVDEVTPNETPAWYYFIEKSFRKAEQNIDETDDLVEQLTAEHSLEELGIDVRDVDEDACTAIPNPEEQSGPMEVPPQDVGDSGSRRDDIDARNVCTAISKPEEQSGPGEEPRQDVVDSASPKHQKDDEALGTDTIVETEGSDFASEDSGKLGLQSATGSPVQCQVDTVSKKKDDRTSAETMDEFCYWLKKNKKVSRFTGSLQKVERIYGNNGTPWQSDLEHPYVQLLYLKDNNIYREGHFLVFANVDSPENNIKIYDSAHRRKFPPLDYLKNIAAYHLGPSWTRDTAQHEIIICFQLMDVQQQLNRYDCGPCSAAFTTDLVLGDRPELRSYENPRFHMEKCIRPDVQRVTRFPSMEKATTADGVLIRESYKVTGCSQEYLRKRETTRVIKPQMLVLEQITT